MLMMPNAEEYARRVMDTLVVGFMGLPGVGKTTLAMEIAKLRPAALLGFGDMVRRGLVEVMLKTRSKLALPGSGEVVPLEQAELLRVLETRKGEDCMLLDARGEAEGVESPAVLFSGTVGQLQQWFGGMAREENPNVFVSQVRERLLQGRQCMALVHDVRKVEEAALVKSMGGVLVRLSPYAGRPADPRDDAGIEHELDGWTPDVLLSAEYGSLPFAAKELLVYLEDSLGVVELTVGNGVARPDVEE